LGVRRGHDRLRAAGAGPGHELPFADRVIVTLARFALPHAALALFYGVHRPTTRAVPQIRPLLAAWVRRARPARDDCTPSRMCSPMPPPRVCGCA